MFNLYPVYFRKFNKHTTVYLFSEDVMSTIFADKDIMYTIFFLK